MDSKESGSEFKLSSFQKQFIASGIGSGISSLVLNPLVVVKVRLQNSFNSGPQGPSASVLSVIRKIFIQDGVGGFYNGGKAALIQSLPSSIIYMTCYEYLKREMSRSTRTTTVISTDGAAGDKKVCSTQVPIVPEFYVPAVSAALARTVSVTAISPIELVRTIQASGVDKSILGIVRDIRTQTGILGLYRGWSSTVLRDVPYSAIYFFTFERLKTVFHDLFAGRGYNSGNSGGSIGSAAIFTAGAFSGMISAVFTHPFDVLKTQRQLAQVSMAPEGIATAANAAITAGASASVAASPSSGSASYLESLQRPLDATRIWFRRYVNWLVHNRNEHHCCVNSRVPCANATHITITLVKQFGVLRGLFRGLSMRLLTVMPSGAIMLTIYETVKKNL